jgi:glycerol-3-phosphate O-acyltransferase/dihydroxyacetone phosphate acyltransferase
MADHLTRRVADRVMRGLADVLITTFFRSVEVENVDALPVRAPTMVVAIHRNGLVDGLLLMAALPRYPRFLGKSTLFKIPPLWPFLKLAGVVPVHRAADGGSTSQNTAAFSTSRRILGAGGVLAVFPEGISHDAPSLQALRTGAARIALETSIDDDVEEVSIVPVGISYDAKARFRSRALVRLGHPQPVRPWGPRYRGDQHEAVRALTDDIADRLRAVAPDYRSWAEAAELSLVAEIVTRHMGSSEPEVVTLARREELVRSLMGVVSGPEGARRAEPLRSALTRYRQELALLGLDDSHIASSAGPARRWTVLGWPVVKAMVATPVALVGTVVHILPYEMVKGMARIPENDGMRATVKLLGCLAGFTTVYSVIARTVGKRLGRPMGALAFAIGPASGYVTVHFFERLQRIGGVVEATRLARGRRATLTSLLASRAAVIEAAAALLSAPFSPSGPDPLSRPKG